MKFVLALIHHEFCLNSSVDHQGVYILGVLNKGASRYELLKVNICFLIVEISTDFTNQLPFKFINIFAGIDIVQLEYMIIFVCLLVFAKIFV